MHFGQRFNYLFTRDLIQVLLPATNLCSDLPDFQTQTSAEAREERERGAALDQGEQEQKGG